MQLSSSVIDRTGYLYLTCLNRSSFITALNLTEPTTISYSIVDYLIQYWRLAIALVSSSRVYVCCRPTHVISYLFRRRGFPSLPSLFFLSFIRPHPTIHTVTPTIHSRHRRHVYKTTVTSTIHTRHAYKTAATPTIHSRHVYNSQLVL